MRRDHDENPTPYSRSRTTELSTPLWFVGAETARQIEVVSMPMSMGLGIAKEVMEGGLLVTRSLAIMDVTVLGG